MRTTLVGSYLKVSGSKLDNLPGTIDRWQRQLISDEALEQEIQKVIRRVIGEQEHVQLDLITDGQIRWEDLPHPLVRSVEGIRRGALRRFFDNNVYYRRLELNGGVQWEKSSVVEEFQFASKIARKPVKMVLPGPLTLVVSTEIQGNQTREELLSLYTDLLRKEVEALEGTGIREIQIDEPAFAAGEPLLSEAVQAVNKILKGVKARRWVACYFHDVSTVLPALAKLQVEVLSLDLVSGSRVTDHLKERVWSGEISLGLIDARNTKLETVSDLVRQVEAVAKVIPANRLWLSPNCGLEFLPHEAVLKKLQLLQEVGRRLS